jgi:CRP-like cAMP-binding protein
MHAAILANTARHITLTPDEQALFISLLVPEHVRRLGYLLQAGQPTRHLTFVVRGCVRTYATDAQGRETVLAFAWEGWWCGDIASAVASSPATLTLQALEATDVLHLSFERLEWLCGQVPQFERFFRLLFQNGFLLEQHRSKTLLQWPAQVRYSRFCRQYPRLSRRVAQKYIASYLGMTPEFLSALRKSKGIS